MRINDQVPHEILGPQSREVQQVSRREAGELSEKAEIRRDGDEATLSKEARLLQRVHQAVNEVPDVREGKIAALRQQIQDGTYRINEEALIDALLGGHQSKVEPGA